MLNRALCYYPHLSMFYILKKIKNKCKYLILHGLFPPDAVLYVEFVAGFGFVDSFGQSVLSRVPL